MFRQLDELLRGKRTSPAAVAGGSIPIPFRRFVLLAILLGATYGLFMGWYAAFTRTSPTFLQMLACMVKIPALFLLTLLITLPSLYVFNALIGCRLSFTATMRLMLAALVVNLTVAASLGPILGFFTFSTSSYSFMVFLNVALLGLAGVVALKFLLQTLRRLAEAMDATPRSVEPAGAIANELTPSDPAPLGAAAPLTPLVQTQSWAIFRIWVIIYALVGTQMGWLLRPFIGSPELPFAWFRPREGNFLQAIARHALALFEP